MNTLNTNTIANFNQILDVMVADYTDAKIINNRISIMVGGKKVTRPIARYIKSMREEISQFIEEDDKAEVMVTISLIHQIAVAAAKFDFSPNCHQEAEDLLKVLNKTYSLHLASVAANVTIVAEVEQNKACAEIAFINTKAVSKSATTKKAIPAETQPKVKTLADIRKANKANAPVALVEPVEAKPVVAKEEAKPAVKTVKKEATVVKTEVKPVVAEKKVTKKVTPAKAKTVAAKSVAKTKPTPKELSEGQKLLAAAFEGKADWSAMATASW